ncbi:ras-related protein Rab-22A-like [Branchiostoma floridae]|uniref:Ras-related protein Rab-22A-like n=1 Tax=Branchiostoma floridae TaxID=7739 RepID=A0A9J7LC30_BRAFL|nr:ras-related protein Rab-22A-like [Branchiostoma floridae]
MSMREIKLCLLGDSGVGKSSLVVRFVTDTFTANLESTIGASFMSKTLVVNDTSYKFQIWDTAGQEKYRGLAPMYYRGAAAAIVVYDITREGSFQTLKDWIRELKQYGADNIVLAIAGNKCDMEDLREVSTRMASDYAEENNAIFLETSAKTAHNVAQMFTLITQRLPSESLLPQGLTDSGSIQLQKRVSASASGKKSCCKQ